MAKQIKTPKDREIINEFAEAINKRKIPTDEREVIPFRNDEAQKKRRDVFLIPLDLLYFRKDNGRITSDVLTHEVLHGELDEASDFGQAKLKEFLEGKDKEKTADLINSIRLNKQKEPAVITADGFLINGNRRKLVLQMLLLSEPSNEEWKYLRVVILPGKNEKEPAPTLNDIEQLENRYQFQLLGKAEYYNFDKALSIRRKISHGMSLEEQLKDDPKYASLPTAKFNNELKKFKEEYLEPLECVDRYLQYFKKTGQYNSISSGYSDREGRWQAFLDYYKSVYKKLSNPAQRISMGIEEDEVGLIEDVAFKIIRKREFDKVDKKVHQIMRTFPKLLINEKSKHSLLELGRSVQAQIPNTETVDKYGKPKNEEALDILWESKYGNEVDFYVTQAFDLYQNKKLEDAPIDLLKTALEKLNESSLNISTLSKSKQKEADEYLNKIISKATILKNDLKHSTPARKKQRK
jgi:hypothetical protein